MRTTNHRRQEVVSLTGSGPDASNRKETAADCRQSHDGAKQRIDELEQQIAELVRLNRELADARFQFQALLDNIPDRIFFKDTQSRFLKLDQALAKRLGVAGPEQAVGKTDFDFQPLERAKEFYTDEQRIMRTGEALISKNEKQVMPNGETTWTSTTKVPIRDPEGKIIGLVGVCRDITQQKRVEERLREYEKVAENSDEMIAVVDRNYRYVMANQLYLRNRVLGKKQILGKSIPEILGREIFESEVKSHLEECFRGKVVHYESRRRYPTVGERTLFISYFPIFGPDGVEEAVGIVRDITERKRAEQALQMFQFATDQAAVGVFWENREAGFYYVNDEACRSLGYSREELMRLPVFDIVPSLSKKQWEERWSQLNDKQFAMQQFETLQRRKDGSTFPVEVVAKHFSADGVELRVAFVHDITQRKQAEESLARERTLLRTLVDNLPDSIFAKDTACRKILANPVDLKYLHCQTEAEAIGKTDFDFYPPDVAASFHADDQKVIQGQPVLNREERNFGEMGEKRWVLTSKLPLRDQSGKIVGLVGIGRDITESKWAAEKIREQAALLDVATDAIWTLDANERISYWNKGAERIYGWSAAEAVGKNPLELLFKGTMTQQLQKCIKTLNERGEWTGEMEEFTKDGQTIVVQGRSCAIYDEQARRKSTLIINTDITKKKKLETQFLRSQRMESLGTLAGGIAHDLNNVLTPLLLSLQLLKDRITDADGHKLLGALQANVERGAKLVKQVLTFGRGIAGDRVPIQPVHIVREVGQIIHEIFPKSVEFEYHCPNDLWGVTGDPTQLHQVLLNLCVNARDAMPQGGKLSIRLNNVVLDESYARRNPESQPGLFVVIAVTDTGTGIPKEIQDRIFEPFFTTKKPGEGTGLGLSTTLGIVKSHGGFIHCYSEPGKGSTFNVYLPADATSAAAENVAIRQITLPRGRGELVLLVDDEEAIREVARKTLERFGYRVLLAANGAEAVSLYTAHRDEITIVITDMAMPMMDGPATIVALRSINPAVKIIGSSGLDSRCRVPQANDAGVVHFIRKPYSTEAMLHALYNVLHEAAA